MSIKTRLTKLEQKLLPTTGKNIEIFYCRDGETGKETSGRLGLNPDDGILRIFLIFE